jgi:hypothetical protein
MSEYRPITCAGAREQFALLLYGELSFDEEERVESHLDACAECRVALEQQRSLHAAMDAVAVTPSPALLARCREDLGETLALSPFATQSAGEREPGWWEQFLSSFHVKWFQPVGALALLAIGFFGGQLSPALNFLGGDSGTLNLAGIAGSRVRNVVAQPDGRVEIMLDELRPRTVSGNMNDQAIRALLMSAARDATDPNLRAGTVAILVGAGDATDVRNALVFAMEHDQSADVRLKAMEGLKSHANDPVVQGALAQILLREGNRGMRTQAIDLLADQEERELDRQIVGTLQELMSREEDTYVRERCLRVLRTLKASAEIY